MRADGGFQDEPQDDFCFPCGVGCECWPLKSKAECAELYRSNESFRKEFSVVRVGAEKAVVQMMRQESVLGIYGCGMRLSIRVAFIEEKVFTVHVKLPPKELGMRTFPVRGPENVDIEGVAMKLSSVPNDVPHYELELYGCSERALHDVMLRPEDVLRAGQAKDRYGRACMNYIKDRESSLKGSSVLGVPSFELVLKEAADIVSIRSQAAAIEDMNREACDGGGQESAGVIITSFSRLDDDCPDHGSRQAAKVAKGRGKGCRGKGKTQGGGRGAAMLPPTSGTSSRSVASNARLVLAGHSYLAGGNLMKLSGDRSANSAQSSVVMERGLLSGATSTSQAGGDAAGSESTLCLAVDSAGGDIEDIPLLQVLRGWNPGRQLKKDSWVMIFLYL